MISYILWQDQAWVFLKDKQTDESKTENLMPVVWILRRNVKIPSQIFMILNILWQDQVQVFLKDKQTNKSETKIQRDQDKTKCLGAFSLETESLVLHIASLFFTLRLHCETWHQLGLSSGFADKSKRTEHTTVFKQLLVQLKLIYPYV
jgi:hypothetical protein